MQPKHNHELLVFSNKPVSSSQARSHFFHLFFHLKIERLTIGVIPYNIYRCRQNFVLQGKSW